MPASLDDLKLNLRVDGNDDDALLSRYLNAAETYVKNAVCDNLFDTDTTAFFNQTNIDNLYSSAVLALASTYYTYRSATVETTVNVVDQALNAIIGQLRGAYELWEDNNNGQENQSQPAQ